MENSGMNASPANGTERVVAADKAGERETNASERLTVPEAAGRRETKEPCPMDAAESMGARETKVPEERSATVRRDGEPLTSGARRRRQRGTVAEEQQAAAGERPSSTASEDMEDVPPLVDDPAGQQLTAAANTGREESIGVYGEAGRPSGQHECRGFGDSRFPARQGGAPSHNNVPGRGSGHTG